MTPSKEATASQEPLETNDSVPSSDDNKVEAEDAASSSTCATNALRVKRVLEINGMNGSVGECAEPDAGNCTTNGKRKLPSWMLSADKEQAENDGCDKSSSSKKTKLNVAKKSNDEVATSSSDGDTVTTVNGAADPDTTNEPSSSLVSAVAQVKAEPPDCDGTAIADADEAGTSNPVEIKPALSVKKEEATSTSRETCKFGIRCYRRNPMHRIEEAHPGDHDYKRPNYPPPPTGTPDCPFGNCCYRRNPVHFQQYNHPPEI